MHQGQHQFLRVEEIILDKSNPRIALWLAMYEGEPTPEQIHQALGAGIEDQEGQGGTKFNSLKTSIITNGGIIQPVIVNINEGGQKICIEGNTRVCLYRTFMEENIPGSWVTIPAVVYNNLDAEAIEAIRLQAHLVGPRQWDPYSKAKYLAYLRNNKMLPFSKLIDYCGGSQKAVMESVQAYADMERYYRPLCESEGDFDPRRFSGFVELQKNNVKSAILQANHTLSDFAEWIYNKKIDPLATVRFIPRILKNKKAKEVFMKRGAVEAIKALDRPDLGKALKEASLAQLSQALSEALNNISYNQAKEIIDNPESETGQALLDVNENLKTFLTSMNDDE